MKNNPFKNFIPFRLSPVRGGAVKEIIDLRGDDIFEPYETDDPTGGTWRTVGMQRMEEGEFIHDLDGTGYLLNVQFNERILPAKVRDEHLAKKIAALTELDGRKPGKKEYAQLRDQVEFELLPKSHIRRSNVYVLILNDNTTLVFASSAKKALDALTLMLVAFSVSGDEVRAIEIEPKNDIVTFLTSVVTTDDIDEFPFEPADNAVLKKAKETIRVKDTSLADAQIQNMLKKDDFAVHELAMTFYEGYEEPRLKFTLNDKFVFKRCEIPDVKMNDIKGADAEVAFHSFAWMVATEYRELLKTALKELGGEHLPAAETKPKGQATDEDDEL